LLILSTWDVWYWFLQQGGWGPLRPPIPFKYYYGQFIHWKKRGSRIYKYRWKLEDRFGGRRMRMSFFKWLFPQRNRKTKAKVARKNCRLEKRKEILYYICSACTRFSYFNGCGITILQVMGCHSLTSSIFFRISTHNDDTANKSHLRFYKMVFKIRKSEWIKEMNLAPLRSYLIYQPSTLLMAFFNVICLLKKKKRSFLVYRPLEQWLHFPAFLLRKFSLNSCFLLLSVFSL
jgi:hypothetical protein